ncbi:MAG: type secretion system protein [Verrucomicrobiaceae bacterium]|nr:type secretion system protein [Verrucomicrobiaceae bacterium]
MKMRFSQRPHAGFSLIELLTVVTVIGVMAAIAIPNIGNINSASSAAKNQRNAQSVVNTFHSGLAMGIQWTGADRNAKVDAVIAGQAASGGVFVGQKAKASGIAGDSLTGIYPYIGTDSNGNLLYDKNGGQATN